MIFLSQWVVPTESHYNWEGRENKEIIKFVRDIRRLYTNEIRNSRIGNNISLWIRIEIRLDNIIIGVTCSVDPDIKLFTNDSLLLCK